MTYPVFATGDPLPASDLNAIGMWLVKSQTIGTGVSSVTVTGAFSADYDNYRIVFNGGTASNEDFCNFTVGGGAAGSYRWGAQSIHYFNTANTTVGVNANQSRIGVLGPTRWGFVLDIFNPFSSVPTNWTVQSSADGYGFLGSGYSSTAASSTAFTISPGAGTITGGTIRVYGYRN